MIVGRPVVVLYDEIELLVTLASELFILLLADDIGQR